MFTYIIRYQIAMSVCMSVNYAQTKVRRLSYPLYSESRSLNNGRGYAKI